MVSREGMTVRFGNDLLQGNKAEYVWEHKVELLLPYAGLDVVGSCFVAIGKQDPYRENHGSLS